MELVSRDYLRIVEVNAYFYPYRGGIEHRVHQIAKRLAKRHDVTIVTSRMPGTLASETLEGYQIIRLDSDYFNIYNPPFVSTPGLLRKLMAMEADVVDFHYRWAPSYAKATRRYPGRKVFTYHNTFGEGIGLMHPFSVLNDILWRRNLRECDRIVCVSEFVKRDLAKRGFDRAKLTAVPNGIEMPERSDGQEGDFILFVGRLVATKGLAYLIQAMRQVDSKLIICGEGPELNHLKRLIARYQLEQKVVLAGRVTQDHRDRLMSTCKMFVMPSVFESYGIAVAEAMSYGRPIVASYVGGLPEVVQDAGLFFRPKDAKGMAVQINQLLHDPAQRMTLGRKARELARAYSWDNVAGEMEAVYAGVAD
jgi:glycosyltransferase involved in cell wall biosynthesis